MGETVILPAIDSHQIKSQLARLEVFLVTMLIGNCSSSTSACLISPPPSPFSSLFLYFLLCWDSVAARGLSLVVVRGLLIVVASPVVAHGLWSVQAQ